VDHGKSTLVKTLTGTDPDRLREEREREMTIDLGFAWLGLPSGASVSVVDVPGHERFIKNMLAGVGGIDAAILVVAADEGPMPQTAEHLAILDLLDISRGVVALTKRDLVDDEWLELITEETRERLVGSALADAPIVPVSSVTGAGLDELLATLDARLRDAPARDVTGRPRLPVDRAFSVAGFGTVVTGTLLGGALELGQELELLPRGLRGRVRGLQSHGRKVERALPGARTAVNLSGVDRADVARGDVLTAPGWLTPTTLLDARVRLVADAPEPLEQNEPVDVFLGAAEAAAHVTLLDSERLEPGAEGWAQLRLAAPLVAANGDRFILRRASPSLTIGGGRVVDAHPRRHRRFRQDVIASLETRATGTPQERLLHALAGAPLELRQLADALGLSQDDTRALADELGEQVVALGAAPARLLARAGWLDERRAALGALIAQHHAAQPLRRGLPREEARSRLGLPSRVFDALTQTLVAQGALVEAGGALALPTHRITLTPAQQQAADRFIAALDANPNAPPAPGEFGLDAELLNALAEQGLLVRVADGVVFGAARFAEIRRETLELIDAHGSLTLAQFRDHFGSSRKYAQAVLEYFDQQRVTRRVGDARVRGASG
jgi:selenocysteine-specific elongation factor